MTNHSAGRPVYGVFLVVVAVLAFAITDVLVKFLVERHPVSVIVAFRYTVSLIMLTALMWPRYRGALWRTERTKMVVLRGMVLSVGSLTMGLALQRIPVAEAVSILYISPFAVMLLAAPLLGERLTPIMWLGAVFGFAGVLLILRPGGGLDGVGVALALANAVLATAYHLLTRFLTRTESTKAMLFHVTLVGAVFFNILAIGAIGDFRPTLAEIGLMLMLGVFATLGHFLFTAAYREAPASLLAPINYMHIVWATGLGWLVFGDIPAVLSALGMGMIIASGVVTTLLARRARKSPPKLAGFT